jgi:nucleoside-diphosphate-sugar epimerase
MDFGQVLITGATGFIGANLARDLVHKGHSVHAVVRAGSDMRRLTEIEERMTFHEADLRDLSHLRRVVRSCRPETIFHLAAFGVQSRHKDRNLILTDNLQATLNLLEALSDHDYRSFVYSGSSAEYGVKQGPIGEDDPITPRTDYGVAKAACTLLCQSESLRGRPISIVRIFTAYGPWEAPPRLVPYVMECCRNNMPPRLTSGRQQRDFIHVQDVVELLQVAAMHPAARGRILHAATGRLHSVREVVEHLVDLSGTQVRPQFGVLENRADEPEAWSASIEVTSALTGWRPRLGLKDGLKQAWDWYRAQTSWNGDEVARVRLRA